ncbi:MAG TPA: AAA family ATPase, partial [Kofleriaceae bacterium]|nr:AAA family ATPase [Kofleriaceae bacterium]
GRLALIAGDAGIGKTALAAALADEAETGGAGVVWGRAWEFAEAPPYFPLWPCLRGLGIEPHGDAFALWEQVVAMLARAPAPAVWIVEDLHAADLGTLDLLALLAQPLRTMRVLVVATARLRDPRLGERMLQRLARIARDGLELRLEPLDEPELAALARDALGRSPPPDVVRRLVELTGGNPLFAVECARAVRGGGAVELAALPPTVRQVVLERVAHLPDATRDALAAGAVLGREFAAAVIARMAGMLPARAIEAVLPALRAGVVRELRPGQFAFSHALVRDAIEDALDADARAALHGRAEAALAPLGDGSDVLVERARHALAAACPGGADRALALATRAAELLEHEGAFDRAFELHLRIDGARAAGFLPPADAESALHVAGLARAAGRADEARARCDAVIARARVAHDPELLARAALIQLADIRPGVIDRAQVALLEEARDGLADRAPALACRVVARLATALQPAPDPAIPMAMAREVRARALALGDPAVVIDVLELAGWGIAEAAYGERVAWASELRDRALAAAAPDKALAGLLWLALARLETGEFTALERDVAAMLAAADELGHPRHRWRALLLVSLHAISAGRFADSDRALTEIEQLAPVIDDPALALALPLHRLMRALVGRRDDEVRAQLAGLADVVRPVATAALMEAILRGVCAARLGDLELARGELARVTARLPLTALEARAVSGQDPVRAFVAELVAAVGSDGERRHMRGVLARLEATDVCGGAITFSHDGPTARVRGLLAASLGERAEAEAALRDALALCRARGHAPWVAQIAHELASVLGDGAEARALADESARLAGELGMIGLARGERPFAAPLRIERAGNDWRLARGAASAIVKDSRGVQLLARLVERPGEDIHVLALASDDAAAAPESTAGEQLDDRARAAYRRRLGELADALADAEQRGDARRAAMLERERGALIGELARATGLAGKARIAGSTSERARVNVQKRLKDAIGRVAEIDRELGAYLERAVRTGTYCSFRP